VLGPVYNDYAVEDSEVEVFMDWLVARTIPRLMASFLDPSWIEWLVWWPPTYPSDDFIM
jgi:hypothetical protein